MLLHGILLEKQHVETSMYNLECRSTEQISWTGPGLAAPTHAISNTRTHTKTEMPQSTEPVPIKLNPPKESRYTCNLKGNRLHPGMLGYTHNVDIIEAIDRYCPKSCSCVSPPCLSQPFIESKTHPVPKGLKPTPQQGFTPQKRSTQRIKNVSSHTRNRI